MQNVTTITKTKKNIFLTVCPHRIVTFQRCISICCLHFIRLHDWRCINNFSTSVHVINIGTYTANWKMNYDQLKSLVMVIKTILCHVFIRFIMNSLNEPYKYYMSVVWAVTNSLSTSA